MSWRSRATVVLEKDEESAAADWRSRATVVEPNTVAGYGRKVKEEAVGIARGVKSMAEGTAKIPSEMLMSGALVGMGFPAGETPIADRYKTITSGLVESIKSIPDSLKDVVTPQAWYDKPISTPMTAASIVLPFLRGGAAAGAAGKTAVTAAAKPSLLRRVFAKATRVGTGLPEESTLARLENPGAVKTAFSHPEVADQVVQSVRDFGTKIGTLSDKAAETLRASPYIEEGAFPRTTIVDAARAARRKIGSAFTKERKSAVKTLREIETDFTKKMKSTVSEKQIRERISELDNQINWDDVNATATNEALVDLRTKLDGMLKKQNPGYAEAMAPVEEAITVRNKMARTFGIKKATKEGYFAGDNTVSKVKNALRGDKLETESVIKRFEQESGQDLTSRMKNANARADFEGEAVRPGMYTRAGAYVGVGATSGEVIGRALGLPPAIGGAIGATMGTIGGAFAEIYGRGVAGKVTDALAKITIRGKSARYLDQLSAAAKQGPKNLAAVHATLLRDDPEYAAAMRDATSLRRSSPSKPVASQKR